MEKGHDGRKNDQLFSCLISDIKTYTGSDPLLPWLQGIGKLKESLPPHLLKEKLPRFLQRCVRTFESDKRYRNDLRYLRVWIQLMDYVDDPKGLLKAMEINKIGLKRAIFYQAYALYYEKLKKFEESDRNVSFGGAKRQEVRAAMTAKGISSHHKEMNSVESNVKIGEYHSTSEIEGTKDQIPRDKYKTMKATKESSSSVAEGQKVSTNCMKMAREKPDFRVCVPSIQHHKNLETDLDKPTPFCSDDTVVVKFVGPAIVGKSEAEDPCHHGLVDPTINMKEAMNAINSMFREPLEVEPKDKRRLKRSQSESKQPSINGFEVFVDESCDLRTEKGPIHLESDEHLKLTNPTSLKEHRTALGRKPLQETFQIFRDDVDGSEDDKENKIQHLEKDSVLHVLPLNISNVTDMENSSPMKPKEDTVFCRFVGSTTFGEPEVENACHHGLVDPTVNLKEALDDINGMFGKPLDFIKTNKRKKPVKSLDTKKENIGFTIFTDDNLEEQKATSCSSSKMDVDSILFEPTVFTKEAMYDINEMFGRPLDF
ncbi:Mad3/BUB1 region 1 [Cinnamomum micranthum f. kanehirae]|uniref:Mad3/BUB1 region 1 n=1 Tax=Cinnamomum micranthum f. kanehirae TaxID=337451 RepID=A0A443NKB9_9MAGN|nr:Mad3/BUB1 region 1 [Cinnamomum micranthum f. kanehirae]